MISKSAILYSEEIGEMVDQPCGNSDHADADFIVSEFQYIRNLHALNFVGVGD